MTYVSKRALPHLSMIAIVLTIAALWPTGWLGHKRLASRKLERLETVERLEAKNPAVLLVGNSMLGEGVDPGRFEELIGIPTSEIVLPGSASAIWFLVMKNVVARLPTKPRVALLFMRDRELTTPDRRVGGKYRELIAAYSDGEEPVVERLAYLNRMPALEHMIYSAFPLYRDRTAIKSRVEAFVKGAVGRLLGVGRKSIDESLELTLADENLRPDLVSARQLSAEDDDASRVDDGLDGVNETFLPHIIEVADEAGIELIIVRVKRRRHLAPNVEEHDLVLYVAALQEYLKARGVEMVDFTHESRLTIDHFAAGDHLSRTVGRPLFTALLAEELKSELASIVAGAK